MRRLSVILALLLASWVTEAAIVAPPARAAAPDFTVLIFSKTAGFRHDSIPAGITAIQQLGTADNFAVEATEDAAQFNAANLARFKAVIFLSTTGDVLDAGQQAAFESYIRGGGGFVGVHAAADTEYSWPWYGGLVGAYFEGHPAPQNATIKVADRVHASTGALPHRWSRFDEWYNYQTNPRGTVHVLATLDESTYTGGGDGIDHPIAWCHNYDGGRSWYTGGGHTIESFGEANFRTHLLGGIRSVAGTAPFECGGTVNSRFAQLTLAKGVPEVGEPMGMSVLPNRGVLHTSRDGTIRYTDVNGNTKVALTLPVYSHDEEGLQSIKVDPGFATNRWVYVYYAPPLSTPSGDAPASGTPADFALFNGVNRVSRFTVNADHTLDAASAVTVIEVPASRGMCCHVGGDLDFDAAGNLYLSTGDDTNPFDSAGYTPIDERPGRNPAFDAQRSAGNTNDLRGKVLRIKPSAGGGYTIPSGNMFAPGTANTKPEIYAMGFRNPFRMSVDRATGVVYLGDYGPDAGTADPARGPAGSVEFTRITAPGFFGWPYCSSHGVPYVEFTFPSGPSGAPYNCAGGPTNNSPNNTGLTQLQPLKPAWIPYGGGTNPPEFSGGAPMMGPVYRYDAALASEVKFPAYFNGTAFIGEFTGRWIRNVVPDAAGAPLKINSFPWAGTQVMDMEFGPDGALYVLDYGTGWFGGDANSALYRIEFAAAGRAPIPVVSATPTSGAAPLTVNFSSAGTSDPDGNPFTFAWDFTTNGSTDSTAANPSFTYTANGVFTATLTVTDTTGKSATGSVVITVGNTAPVVTLNFPANGQVFNFGDLVQYSVTATDAEDPSIDCSRVKVTYILGHDSHGHPVTSATGCTGSIQTTSDGEHDAAANIFGVFDAEYTDGGAPGVPPVTTHKSHVLQPRLRQAEHAGSTSGITVVSKPSAHGGAVVGYIDNGDWISFTPYHLGGVSSFTARVASAGAGGTLSVRSGSPTGPLAGSVTISPTGGWETWVTVTGAITPPAGTQQLHLVFTGGAGALFDLDEFSFGGTTQPPTGDLALNKPALASSTEAAAYPASAAVDGSATTRWSSAFSDPQWIRVDLGQSYSINRVKLTWEAAFGSAYEVQTSPDGTTWTTIRSVTAGDGGVDDLTGLTGTGRYLRIYGTTRGTGWGYSLFELEVYA